MNMYISDAPLVSRSVWKVPYLKILGLCITECLLASISFSYGIIYAKRLEEEYYTENEGLWTIILFVAVQHIASPWVEHICEYFENSKYRVHRKVSCLSVLMLTLSIILSASISNATIHVLSFGIITGSLSVGISKYFTYQVGNSFEENPGILEIICQMGKASALFVAPHFILFLCDSYGTSTGQYIYGVFLLHMIPAYLLIKAERIPKPRKLTSYATLSRLQEPIIEQVDSDGSETEINFPTSGFCEDEIIYTEIDTPSVQKIRSRDLDYYFTTAGVSILPIIPEESESDSEIPSKINRISAKRLSKISIQLEKLNNQDEPYNFLESDSFDFKEKLQELNIVADIDVFNRDRNIETLMNSEWYSNGMKLNKCGFSQKFYECKYFLLDKACKPLCRSLRSPYFYVMLISKVSLTTISTLFIVSSPYLFLLKGREEQQNIYFYDAAFILSIMSFAWLFFLISSPLLLKMRQKNIQILFSTGTAMAACSFLVMVIKYSTGTITLSSLIYGLAYGNISYTENVVYKGLLGLPQWNRIKGTLETLTGILMLVVYTIIHQFNVQLNVLIFAAMIANIIISVMFTLLPILNRLLLNLEKLNRSRHTGIF